MGRRNPLTDWPQFFPGERYPWRNHARQIWWRSLKGFMGGLGVKIQHFRLCWSSLQLSHYRVSVISNHVWIRKRSHIDTHLVVLVLADWDTVSSPNLANSDLRQNSRWRLRVCVIISHFFWLLYVSDNLLPLQKVVRAPLKQARLSWISGFRSSAMFVCSAKLVQRLAGWSFMCNPWTP